MQGVVDADATFRIVQVNLPGRVHDYKDWDVSQATQEAQNHFGISTCVVELDEQRIKPYVLADSAYPGGEDVMKPYLYSRVNDTDKRRFNLRHCISRQVVEQAFGMLKCRWRLLLKTQEVPKHETLQLLVMSCCTLHNMCVADRIPFDAAMANAVAEEYSERYGGFVVDPYYAPSLDRMRAWTVSEAA
jgi:hypothetical protein